MIRKLRASMGQLHPWTLLFSGCSYFSRSWKYSHVGEENSETRFIGGIVSEEEFVREINRVNSIAWPMILVSVSQFLLRLMPIFMLGHGGQPQLTLSAASMAFTFCNITGFSVLLGMASALETLCGQAFGAEQYKQVGTFTNAAIFSLLIISLPISILWIFTNNIFLFLGQDPSISKEAEKFAIWLIPSLFPFAILKSLTRYLQAQNVIEPMVWSSLASLLIDLLLCWVSVFKMNLGSIGAAISVGLAYWFNVAMLGIYVKYSQACEKTYASFSNEVFFCLPKFFQFAIPSAFMVCLEWWCFELIIFFSGILPNPQIEVNVLSICTRISNEVGAGNPKAARLALFIIAILSITEFRQHVIGYAYIKEKEVVVYIGKMGPLLSLGIIFDSLQALLSGVARGCGWQQTAAYINLGAYYVVGIPVALLMGFTFDFKGEGLWIGLVAGSAVQCFLFSVATCLTDWDKMAIEARQRIFEGTIPVPQIELT